MKALISTAIGGPETLVMGELPDPKARPGMAIVEVKACGVNYPDVLIIEDKYQFKPARPFAPGGEVSGIVTEIGEGVTHVKVGDRVLGNTGWGGMAAKIAMDARKLVQMPEGMSFEEAAAFIMTYGTSYYALKWRGHLQPGETLLVLGAAGGVGLAAVELGRAMGARVIAACSTQEKVDLCLAHGADDGVVYPAGALDKDASKALAEAFKNACGGDGCDVCYDGVGGDYCEPALRTMAWEGRYLVVGFPAGIPRPPLNLTLLKGCDIVGVFWGTWTNKDLAGYRQSVNELLDFYKAGKIKPHVSAVYPMSRAADAITHLAERRALGKVVVTID